MIALERALTTPPDADLDDHLLAQRFAERAAAEGLVDVVYASVDSPLGPLLAAATPRGLVRLSFAREGHEPVLLELARRLSPRVIEAPSQLDDVRRELDEYFTRQRTTFSLPVDMSLVRGFGEKVLAAARAIPYGSVRTYAEVAAAAGSPTGARAAGNALGSNPIPIVVPCHRVVRSGGGLGGYTGGLDIKVRLLELEGSRLV